MNDVVRNATLADLGEILRDQHARKVDIVAPASKIRAAGGLLLVEGADPVLTETGVTSADGAYRPTRVADEGIAAKLGVPQGYLRKLRETGRTDIWDANVNGWLQGDPAPFTGHLSEHAVDPRSFLVRGFRADDSPDGPGLHVGPREGVARAFLSDSYHIIDNLDVLTAALEGVRDAGVEVEVQGTDLTERRMYVKVFSPAVAEVAPALLQGYRSPWTGAEGTDNPTIFAGFVISNSETGGGAFTITPRLVVQICGNGMTVAKDALRSIHLGGKMDEGVVRWSNATLQKNLELVTAQAKDAVATFLDPAYVSAKIAQLSEAGAEPVNTVGIETITKGLSYTPERSASVLDFFVKGGQLTLGGVANAITAAAQAELDGDDANAMEADAVALLGL